MKDIFEGVGLPLTQAGFDATSNALGGDKESLWSVLKVETRGFGFFTDRRPKILFERHVFSGRTGGRFDRTHPDISSSKPGGYVGGPPEYNRLKRAMLLDRKAALESASWGLGQVMGFNATKIGYASAEAMVRAFAESEDEQLEGCAAFILATKPLHDAYKAKKWAKVAFFYNGRDFAKNKYDQKLADAHAAYTARGSPRVDVRQAQAFLTYLGFDPKGIDGEAGKGTLRALDKFRPSYRDAGGGPPLPAEGSASEAYVGCLAHSFKAKFG